VQCAAPSRSGQDARRAATRSSIRPADTLATMEALFVVLMAVVVLAVGYLALLAVYRMSRTEKTGEA
jgi:hypothetical protein